jgi:hypothetical protein
MQSLALGSGRRWQLQQPQPRRARLNSEHVPHKPAYALQVMQVRPRGEEQLRDQPAGKRPLCRGMPVQGPSARPRQGGGGGGQPRRTHITTKQALNATDQPHTKLLAVVQKACVHPPKRKFTQSPC